MITEYEKEIMARTGWDIDEVRRVLCLLDSDKLSPKAQEYYLEKISPF